MYTIIPPGLFSQEEFIPLSTERIQYMEKLACDNGF
jgi:hypothetical protein